MGQQILKSARYPNLQTVLMVEKFIKENSMFYTKREIFNKLPKSMLWGTFKIIIDYLESTLKIITDDDGVISYIWNPELLEKIRNRPEIKI
ncbi:hypothetical protein KAI04_03120 [Candidatus Pacearchaeota archaeon]|nr:hypothetical protein [Candidatus Pacearchaeota archaeon]